MYNAYARAFVCIEWRLKRHLISSFTYSSHSVNQIINELKRHDRTKLIAAVGSPCSGNITNENEIKASLQSQAPSMFTNTFSWTRDMHRINIKNLRQIIYVTWWKEARKCWKNMMFENKGMCKNKMKIENMMKPLSIPPIWSIKIFEMNINEQVAAAVYIENCS